MKITPLFKWFDMWVGIYVDRRRREVYIFPVPMFGIKVSLR